MCAAVLLVVGCGDEVTGTRAGGDLTGRTFLSQAVLEDGVPRDVVEGTQISLHFHDDGRFTANAGCNTLLADLTITDDVLQIDGVGMTEMGCPPDLMEQDRWLAEFLGSSPAWALDGDDLTLSSGVTELVLLDREVADPDRPLEGIRWEVDTIISGDGPDSAASSMIGGTEGDAWLEIIDGQLTAESGCREFSGTANAEGDRLVFTEVSQTDQACDPAHSDVDDTMMSIFAGEADYEITASRLTLSGPAGAGLSFRATE